MPFPNRAVTVVRVTQDPASRPVTSLDDRSPGGPSGAAGAPLSPVFTTRTDHARGVVTVRGRLDRRGAELVSGLVEVLVERGHRTVTVDLSRTTGVDAGAAAALDALAGRLATGGTRLDVG